MGDWEHLNSGAPVLGRPARIMDNPTEALRIDPALAGLAVLMQPKNIIFKESPSPSPSSTTTPPQSRARDCALTMVSLPSPKHLGAAATMTSLMQPGLSRAEPGEGLRSFLGRVIHQTPESSSFHVPRSLFGDNEFQQELGDLRYVFFPLGFAPDLAIHLVTLDSGAFAPPST